MRGAIILWKKLELSDQGILEETILEETKWTMDWQIVIVQNIDDGVNM